MRKRLFLSGCAVVFASLAMAGSAVGQEIDLSSLIHETQRVQSGSGKLSIVWWIPGEFWRASLSQNKNVSASEMEQLLKVVHPYTIVVVLDGTVGMFGGVEYEPEERVRANISLVDAQGTSYKPRTDAEVSADVRNLLAMMKPTIANMIGPMGQNLHFFVFPAETKAGAPIAKPTEKGRFLVKLGENEYKWRLPLDSLLPGKVCPGCSEACKGSWSFCPWCGAKLTEKAEPQKP